MNKLLLVSVVALSVGGCADVATRNQWRADRRRAPARWSAASPRIRGAERLVGGAVGAVAGAAIADRPAPLRRKGTAGTTTNGHWVCRYY